MIDRLVQTSEKSTRTELLMLLKMRGPITVQDMSETLGVTSMAIRRHLYLLQKDHYIKTTILRRSSGRPVSLYSLSETADLFFPMQYDDLLEEFIDEIKEMQGEPFLAELFERRMKKLERKYEAAMRGQNLEQRILTLAHIQEQEGYMVAFEKQGDRSYSFEESNCPIVRVAALYRHACRCELSMFETLLDAKVVRTECIADGGMKCHYHIEERGVSRGANGHANFQ